MALFVVLLAMLMWLSCEWTENRSDYALLRLNDGITTDKAYLLDQGNAIADDSRFIDIASTKNPEIILTFIKEEREHHNIGLMGFANENGIVISRTRTASSTGENTFLVSPQGRSLAAGAEHVASVEISSFDPVQLLMTTGRHVYKDGARIGALFTNRLMDDTYATVFRDRYLPRGSEVLFYTKEYGIYGSSIVEPEMRKVIRSYFSTDSGWVRSGESGTMVRFGINKYYLIRNIVFVGIEGGQSGGALVLVPYYGYSGSIRFVFATVAFIVFVLIAWKRRPSARLLNRYYYWTAISFAFLMGISMVILGRTTFIRYAELRTIPYVLYNSTLRLQPEAGVFDTQFERPVSILLDTGSEHINVVSTVLEYDPRILEVSSVDTEDSICTQFLEKMVDVVHSTIRVVCGLPTPGFSGQSGIVATVIFKPLRTGASDVRFTNETEVLANDGIGTNVLRFASNGSYRFMDGVEHSAANGLAAARKSSGKPIVYSSTHPNMSRWYTSRDIKLFWTNATSTVGSVYSFDQFASSTLLHERGIVTHDSKAAVKAPEDGVFYFHVASLTSGEVSLARDYKVMVDSTPPENVSILSSVDEASVGDVVRFEFKAEDAESGLQNTMYIDINNSGLFLPVGKQTYVPFTDPGVATIHLRVYDKAGNFTQVEKTIKVSGKPGQWLMKLTH